MKKILLIGSGGQVATELVRRKPDWCQLDIAGRDTIDLTDTDKIRPLISASNADLIINAAAYTAVDRAEEDGDTAHRVNARAPGEIALGAADIAAPIIHISTDYVFNGEGKRPYKESDATDPLGVYGRTKLAGERAVAAATAQHLIVRTAWVFSAHGHNFVKSMLRLGGKLDRLTIVSDQLGSPTFAGDLADAIWTIAGRLTETPQSDDFGIVNVTGNDIATWYDFARTVFAVSKPHGGPTPEVVPILTEDYPTLARRPANSRLELSRLENHFGINMRPWRAGLEEVLKELHGVD
ncbi:MAG: dTDP-4-dehydrorhamnose reductase [Pseudomonadota bacterium]